MGADARTLRKKNLLNHIVVRFDRFNLRHMDVVYYVKA